MKAFFTLIFAAIAFALSAIILALVFIDFDSIMRPHLVNALGGVASNVKVAPLQLRYDLSIGTDEIELSNSNGRRLFRVSGVRIETSPVKLIFKGSLDEISLGFNQSKLHYSDFDSKIVFNAVITGRAQVLFNMDKLSSLDLNLTLEESKDVDHLTMSGKLGASARVQSDMVEGDFEVSDGRLSGLKILNELKIPLVQRESLNIDGAFNIIRSEFSFHEGAGVFKDAKLELNGPSLYGAGQIVPAQAARFVGELWLPMDNPPKTLRSDDGRLKVPIEIQQLLNQPGQKVEIKIGESARKLIRKEAKNLIDQLKDQIQDKEIKKLLDKAPAEVDKFLKDLKF